MSGSAKAERMEARFRAAAPLRAGRVNTTESDIGPSGGRVDAAGPKSEGRDERQRENAPAGGRLSTAGSEGLRRGAG
jgi:hypothetical protein